MVGANGSAAYADIDSGVAVAVMRNRFGDLATVAKIDRIERIVFIAEPATSIDTRLSDSDVIVSRLNETAGLESAELSRNLNP
jgi:hypothetical protein